MKNEPATLSQKEWFILEWISGEDSNSYGECHGPELDRLIEMKFVAVAPPPRGYDIMYGSVSITPAGLEALRDSPLKTK